MSPYLAQLGRFFPNLHFILFGILGVTAGLLNLKLAETKDRPLPDDIHDLLKILGSNNNTSSRRASKEHRRNSPVKLTGTLAHYSILSVEDDSEDDEGLTPVR